MYPSYSFNNQELTYGEDSSYAYYGTQYQINYNYDQNYSNLTPYAYQNYNYYDNETNVDQYQYNSFTSLNYSPLNSSPKQTLTSDLSENGSITGAKYTTLNGSFLNSSIEKTKQTTQSLKENLSPVSINNLSPQDESCSYSKRNRSAKQLPEKAVDILNDWFESHLNHPYPSTDEKQRLADQCQISAKQVNSWFCNRRNRSQNTKPKRIKKQLEQQITNVFNELAVNPNQTQVLEKFRSCLRMHDIAVTNH